MKRLSLFLTILVTILNTHLHAATFTAGQITITPGQTTQLVIGMNNTEANLSGFQFKLYLPDGFSVTTNDKGKFVYTQSSRIEDHTISIRSLDDGGYLVVAYSMDADVITGSSGELMSISVTADETASTSGNGSLSNIRITDVSSNTSSCNDVSFAVNVNIPATGISLSSTSLTLTSAGQTSTLTATVTPSNATNKNVTWTSSNPAVATVSNAGVVTAVANGTATIIATTADGSNKSATCSVTINISPTITFADVNVKALCVANWDTDGDGELSEAEAAAVTNLGEVFKENTTITSFEELQYFTGLSEIPDNAFNGCTNLQSILFPEGLTRIGASAFYNCSSLTSITLPSSLTSTGNDSFRNCTGLTAVHISDFDAFCRISFGFYAPLFYAHRLYLNGEEVTGEIVFPDGITSVSNAIFEGCTGITSVVIPEVVTHVGQAALRSCPNLTSVTLPSTVKTIATDAFRDNANLSSINLPEGLTSIGENAFNGCSGLTSIAIPSSVTSIGNAFWNCTGLTKAIYSSIEHLCSISFASGSGNPLLFAHHLYIGEQEITDLVIPSTVTSIGNSAFNGGSGITSVTLHSGVTSIGDYAFDNNWNLTTVIAYMATPPAINEQNFVNRANATLTVPYGSKAAYEAADYWKEFGTIVEMMTPATGITLNKTSLILTTAGQTSTLTATVTPNDATDKSVTWTSSNPDVATVSSAGVVTAVANGAATIKATTADGSDLTAKCAVTVNISVIDPVSLFDENSIYYIQNVETDKYLNAGNAWGTHTVLSDEGLPVKMTLLPDGSYTIYFLEGSQNERLLFRDSAPHVYVDYNSNNSNAAQWCKYWTITPASEDGTYHIQSLVTDALYGQEACPGTYLGNNPTKEACDQNSTPLGVYNDVDGNVLDADGMNITWRFVNTGITRTFNAEVPCGEGTADLTFKVSNFSQREVEVIASPEDIAGALTIPATVQSENGIEFAVKRIADWVFSGRQGLTSVSLPETLYQIGDGMFYNCANLASINIPTGVVSIHLRAFSGCTALTSVTLPEGLSYIGENAFSNSGLESITFPSTLTTVGYEAFRDCKDLQTIDFNDCSATFDYHCFSYCTSLEELYVPNTVKFQNWNMFMGCTSLQTAVFEAFEDGQETWWATTLFNECSALEEVVLPSTSVVKTGFFHMCTNLKSVTYLELADNFDVVADSYHKMYHNVPVQPLFIIPEGTAETFLHAGYMKLSDLSGLPLVREEFEAEAARIAAMADELTDGDKTALSNAISNARTAVNAAEDYATIYSQIAAIKNAAKAFLATATLSDGFEVTAAYVTNPDVDRFDFGWTVAGGDWLRGRIGESKENGDVTFNNYITVWNGVALDIQGSAISQTITYLPAGNYRLEADVIATNQNDATEEVTGVNLFAGSSMTVVATENQKPQHFSLEFTQAETGNCTIGIDVNTTNANWVAMDNVHLYRLADDEPEPDKMLYAEDISAPRGAQIELPIQLDNGEEGITAFQFDVKLPEGVTLLGCTLSDRKANQGNPTPSLQSDGSYRLATLSLDNSLFSGTAGDLLYLTLKISTEITPGDYDISLKNIELSTPSKVIEQPETKSKFAVLEVMTGDANGDGKVSIFDAVQIVNYILGNNPSPFIFSAADLDGNGKITIFDAVSTVNIILNQGASHQVKPAVQTEIEPQ